ncbi:MAG TPA: hypothetical protein DCW90_23460 [Lachnospiraceae bacterium]|nr:hypothetical protein [Lachnospiraceae bacterium]
MIRIENVDVFGWESAIRGMRNPMNSWDKSNSQFHICSTSGRTSCTEIGNNDLKLMQSLVKAGTDHSKFMRMINVSCDIVAPRYWWTEYDTYKVGTVRNSCSTMHKIAAKEFETSDFSREHLTTLDFQHYDILDTEEVERIEFQTASTEILRLIIQCLNNYRKLYLATKNKKYWWQMIQILPQSYNQRATVQLNYAVLREMYHARKNHKLDEWIEFCKWIETLPYSELITA